MNLESLNNCDIEDHYPTLNQSIKNAFTESDPSIIHNQLNRFSQLQQDQKINVVKKLPIIMEKLGNQGSLVLKPLLYQIIKNNDQIIIILLEQMSDIVAYLQKHQNFELHTKNTIIPILIQCLNFTQLEIKQQAGQELGKIAHKLIDTDRGNYVLKHIIEMAHDDSEENRIVAVQLFSNLSDCFGQQLCEQFIGLEILSLGDDPSVRVRKQAIKNLPIISTVVSKQFFANRFSSFYLEKAKDTTCWMIRKSCIDVFLDIAQVSSDTQKEGKLTQLMLAFLNDSNRWVKITAYKYLGKFIYMLKNLKIHHKLIEQYLKMPDLDICKQNEEIIYHCAFYFPAVVDVLGKSKWLELYPLYHKLLKCSEKKVKITLSQSVHEIAKIIGEAYTEKYLFKVIDAFIKEKNDQIKLGVIRHLTQIMEVLSVEKRQSLVGVFVQFQKDQRKWRIRQCISQQLGKLLEIYSMQIILTYLVPLLLKLCSDSVLIVREEAAVKVAEFIIKLTTREGLEQGLIESVKAFGTSPKYTQRQSFLMMCNNLMKHKTLFEDNFLSILIGLKHDKVINVQLVLAQLVKNHMDKKGELSSSQKFKSLYQELKNDKNQEISYLFLND